MAEKPRKKAETKKSQAARFKKAARQIGADESGETFSKVVSKLLKAKRSNQNSH